MGFLFGGSRRRMPQRRGLFGSLFGGAYAQPRRRGLLGNPLVRMAALGALGYAANRFRSRGNFGGNSSFGSGGGQGNSNWGDSNQNNSGFDQNGKSW